MDSHPRPIEPPGLFEGLSPEAILFGAIVDNVATVVVFLLLGEFFLGSTPTGGGEAPELATAELYSSPEFLLSSLVLGLGCTVLGAAVGAYRAGTSQLRHGGWIAVTSVLLSLVFLLIPTEGATPSPPLWYDILGWVLILPAGLAGGALAAALSAPEGPHETL
jgi:hypothetical protein